jgi:hypothetical protein
MRAAAAALLAVAVLAATAPVCDAHGGAAPPRPRAAQQGARPLLHPRARQWEGHPAVRHGWRAPPGDGWAPGDGGAHLGSGAGRALLQDAAASASAGAAAAAAKKPPPAKPAAPLPAAKPGPAPAAPVLPEAAQKSIEGQLRERLLKEEVYDRLSFPWAEHGPANVSLSLVFYRVLHVDLYGGGRLWFWGAGGAGEQGGRR